MPPRIPRVLILCTANSARSQMGEAILRHLAGDTIEVTSAGTRATSVHPLAIEAMREVEVDMSGQRSKSVEEFQGQEFDAVITVCDQARDACPMFPGRGVRVHYSIPDPAAVEGSPEERLEAFRRARDLLFSCLCEFVTVLVGPVGQTLKEPLMQIQINGESREVPEGLHVAGLLAHLGLNPARVAIERNLEVLPRAAWSATPVAGGDRFEIVHFVGGG